MPSITFLFVCSTYKIKALDLARSFACRWTRLFVDVWRNFWILCSKTLWNISPFLPIEWYHPYSPKSRCQKNFNSTFPDNESSKRTGILLLKLKNYFNGHRTEGMTGQPWIRFSGNVHHYRDVWAHMRAHLPLSFSLRNCDFFLLLVSGLRLTFRLFSMFNNSWNISLTFSFVLADVSMKPQPHFFACCWPWSVVTCRSLSGSSHLFPTSISGAASRSLPFTSLMTSKMEASSARDWEDVTE